VPATRSRRHVLIGALSVPIAATSAAKARPAHPDAALLAACASFHAAVGESKTLSMSLCGGDENLFEERLDALGHRMDRAVEEAAILPAQTAEGTAAKGRMVRALRQARRSRSARACRRS
jgi:hypothetical protein